jgi:hypothetical protein
MTANPRTKIVTDYDVEKLADNYGRLHGCYFLPHQNACELCKREAADFLASLPEAPTPKGSRALAVSAVAQCLNDAPLAEKVVGVVMAALGIPDATTSAPHKNAMPDNDLPASAETQSHKDRPRTVTVTEQDVERLALMFAAMASEAPGEAHEIGRSEAWHFLASLPDALAPEEKPMGFGYCPMCCHALDQCSHCDAPTEAPEPSHDFKPTEFGGDTCERCDKDVRSHLLPDAPTPTEAENRRVLSDEVFQTLHDVGSIFDGWHTDVAWTEWDKSVRDRVGALLSDAARMAIQDAAAAERDKAELNRLRADAPTTRSEPVAYQVISKSGSIWATHENRKSIDEHCAQLNQEYEWSEVAYPFTVRPLYPVPERDSREITEAEVERVAINLNKTFNCECVVNRGGWLTLDFDTMEQWRKHARAALTAARTGDMK